MHAGRRRIDDARRELRRELTSPDPDRGRVEALLTGIGSEQDALDRALVENVFAARELLDGDAEREYLRFVERFGGAFAGGRPPGLRPMGLPAACGPASAIAGCAAQAVRPDRRDRRRRPGDSADGAEPRRSLPTASRKPLPDRRGRRRVIISRR